MVYNGRRAGEIQSLMISDFMKSSQSVSDNPVMFKNNTGNNNYTRCTLRGELGRNVSIVLANEEVHIIKDILNYRELADKFADDAGVQHPERLYATNIRKNLATKTSGLSLNVNEQEHVINFMGHSASIHKSICRQPDMQKDITIMPRILDFATGKDPLKDKSTGIFNTPTQQGISTKEEYDSQAHSASSITFEGSDGTYEKNYAPDGSEYVQENSDLEEMRPKRKRRLIDESSFTSSQEERDDNELMFIADFVKDHPIILNKSQIPSVKTKKEEYLKQMKIDIQNEYGTKMDSRKILKKLNNLKTNIKKKTDRKATGNKKIKLSAAESVIYNIMQCGSDENPVFSKVPGNVEVGVSKDIKENIEHPPIKIPSVLVSQKKKKMDLHKTSRTKNVSNSELQRFVRLEQLFE
ncbi:hypothetical protein JTB14_004753 [Gonioctena quinquepunctata]|nr:hypothetical protein JTB14_004753 [Gonioctena quinquepunctata]